MGTYIRQDVLEIDHLAHGQDGNEGIAAQLVLCARGGGGGGERSLGNEKARGMVGQERED